MALKIVSSGTLWTRMQLDVNRQWTCIVVRHQSHLARTPCLVVEEISLACVISEGIGEFGKYLVATKGPYKLPSLP